MEDIESERQEEKRAKLSGVILNLFPGAENRSGEQRKESAGTVRQEPSENKRTPRKERVSGTSWEERVVEELEGVR